MNRFKLGLLPWRDDPRHLQFARYKTGALPPPWPGGVDWTLAMTIAWRMLGNGPDPANGPAWRNGIGNCFFVMMANIIMAMTANSGNIAIFDTAGVAEAYSGCTGFDIITGANDNGTDPVIGLNYCRKVGIRDINGKYHKIGAWMAVNKDDPIEVAQALDTFGPLALGVSLPNSWESASLWDRATDDGSTAGGHAVGDFARDLSDAPIKGVKGESWTTEPWIGYDAWDRVMFIAAIVSPDWISDTGKAPSGLDMAALTADLAQVTA